MALGDIMPWKRGSLGRRERQARPFDTFRQEMESLHRDMDRLFEGLWSEGIGSFVAGDPWDGAEIVPQLDVSDDEKALVVKADLPGLDEKDIDVTLSDRRLTIRGEKKEDNETREKDFYRRERTHGTFRRSIEVPADVDATNIEASFKDGVLTIRLPKTKEAQEKIKHIDVKGA